MAFTKEFELNAKTNAQDVQQQFTDLRNGIRETTDAIEGLDKSSKTYEKDLRNLTAELTEMEQAQKELKKSNTDLGASFEDIHGEMKPLTGQMGEMEDRLYQLALSGDTTSQTYKDLLAEVGKYRKVQIQTDLAVDNAAGTMSQKLGTALQGAASGFAAVQGGMALFGSESEAVEETLLKVNSAMALSQGIAGIQDASKQFGLMSKATKGLALAQKGLNLVMAANPLAIITTLVIGIIGYFAVFTDAIDTVVDSLKSVGDWLGITDSEAEEMAEKRKQEDIEAAERKELQRQQAERLHNQNMNAIDNEIAIAQAQGKDTTALQKKKLQEIIKVKKARLDELAVTVKELEIQKEIIKAVASLLKLEGDDKTSFIEKETDKIDAKISEVETLKKDIAKAETDLKILDIKSSKRSTGRTENYKSEEDEKAKIKADAIAKENAIEKARLDNLKKLREEALAELEQEDEARYQKLIGEQQAEINVVNDKYFRLIELAKEYGEDTTALKESQEQQIAEIEEKYRLEKEAKEKETADKLKEESDKQINDSREEWNTKLSLASDSLGAINDLVQVFAGEGEEAQRKAFEVNKAISIGQAVISTAQGIMGQLAVPQDALTGANFVKAGIVAATGVTQIAKISQTKFQGGGSTGGSNDVPSGNVGGQAPQFNVVGDSGISQLADINSSPTQAYVVSGEVTTAQSLDRNRIKNATI